MCSAVWRARAVSAQTRRTTVALAHSLGDVEAPPVGLPAAERGEPGVGGVALGLAVADEADAGPQRDAGLGGGHDLLGPGHLGGLGVEAVGFGRQRLEGEGRGPALPEAAQVQRDALVHRPAPSPPVSWRAWRSR